MNIEEFDALIHETIEHERGKITISPYDEENSLLTVKQGGWELGFIHGAEWCRVLLHKNEKSDE